MKRTRAGRNYALVVVWNISAVIFPLVTLPLLAHRLGAEGLGVFALSFALQEYFSVLASLGIDDYGSRLVASHRAEGGQTASLERGLLRVRAGLALVAAGAFVLTVLMLRPEHMEVFLLQGVHLLARAIEPNWILIGREQFGKVVGRNLIVRAVVLIVVVVIVRDTSDLWLYTLGFGTAVVLGNALTMPSGMRRAVLGVGSRDDWRAHLRPLGAMAVPVAAVLFDKNAGRVSLGAFHSVHDVAMFDGGLRLLGIPLLMISSFGTVMAPNVAARGVAGREAVVARLPILLSRAVALAVTGVVGAVAFSGAACQLLLTPEFKAVALQVTITALALPFVAWTMVLRSHVALPSGSLRQYVRPVAIGALTSIPSYVVLVAWVGAMGAAIGYVVSEMIVCWLQTRESLTGAAARRALLQVAPVVVLGAATVVLLVLVGANATSESLRSDMPIVVTVSCFAAATVVVTRGFWSLIPGPRDMLARLVKVKAFGG